MQLIHSKTFHWLFLLSFFLGHTQCSIGQQASKNSLDYQFPYQLNEPAAVFELPDKLVEISGLSLSSDHEKLVAIQDEDGIIFSINKTTGEVEKEIPFGKNGDYEGLEQIGKDIYIVKSSGKIYAVKNAGLPNQEVTKYETPLNKEFDVEGLAYDAQKNSLLLACKGQPDALAKEAQFAKAVYHFNLDGMVFDSIPAMIIDQQDIINYFQDRPLLIKMKKDGSAKEVAAEDVRCNPSSLAIHPLTGNYYICSSKGKVLFVVSPSGTLVHIEKLNKKVLPQPEGLAFDEAGNLFIANEGDDKKGKICRFGYRK